MAFDYVFGMKNLIGRESAITVIFLEVKTYISPKFYDGMLPKWFSSTTSRGRFLWTGK